jgi:methionyl-tRNA formyltransferase
MKKVLFFGLKGCSYSKQAINFLSSMGCDVDVVSMKDRSFCLDEKTKAWSGDLILSFKNYIKLPLPLINRASVGSINFHPATPDYPGSGGLAWSIYHGKQSMGVTVHLMNAKLDNGKILKVYKNKIQYPTTLEKCMPILNQFHLNVFKKFTEEYIFNQKRGMDLTSAKTNLEDYVWGKPVLRISDLEEMKFLNSAMDQNEIERRISAFHHEKYPIKFLYKKYVFNLKLESRLDTQQEIISDRI